MLQVDAEWEVLEDTPVGMAVVPYLTTTEAASVMDLPWKPEDAKQAIRSFMASPTDSNMTTLDIFNEKTAGPGQPETPATRQRVAWPPARDTEVFEEEVDQTSKRNLVK